MQEANYGLSSSILKNTTNITDIHSATPGEFPGEPTLYILVVALLILGIILLFVSGRMRDSYENMISGAGTVVLALSVLFVCGASALFLHIGDKTPDENNITEKLHRDILISNNFNMNSYDLEEINDFKNDGKILHWEDINSRDVSFLTWHDNSSDVDHIEISVVDGYNIRTVEPSDSRSSTD